MITKTLSTKEIVPNEKHSATVIFFHGSALDVVVLKNEEETMHGNEYDVDKMPINLSNVWFDRKSVTIDSSEDRNSVANVFDYVNDLIKREMELGIPLNRIVVGGYSMGGSLALYTGFHLFENVAAVFSCSSFLNRDAMLFEYLKSNKKHQLPKLLYFHGRSDELVRYEWGLETFNRLKELGIDGEFHSIENTYHELQSEQLLYLEKWFHKMLPPFELRNKL